jgi:hypothetical protein
VPKAIDDYLAKVRDDAENEAFEAGLATITERRKAERFLAKRGAAAPLGDLTLRDMETLEKTGTLQALRENPHFAARERFLREEEQSAILAAREAGEDAVQAAAALPPPLIRLADDHEKEAAAFLAAQSVAEPEALQPAFQPAWILMQERHVRETAAMQAAEAKKAKVTNGKA